MKDRKLQYELLCKMFGPYVQNVEGSWFLVNDNVTRVCYSKDLGHSDYKRYFFGIQKEKYQKYHSRGIQVLFICGDADHILLLPTPFLDKVFNGVSVANDNSWKLDIHKMSNRFELVITGKPPFDVTAYRIKTN